MFALIGDATSGSMSGIISQLNTGISSSTIFETVGELMPWVITLTIASFGFYELRKLVKGASKAKVRF